MGRPGPPGVSMRERFLRNEMLLGPRAMERLAAAHVINHSLSNFDAVCEVAAEEGKIKPEDIERLKKFRADPSDESWIASK